MTAHADPEVAQGVIVDFVARQAAGGVTDVADVVDIGHLLRDQGVTPRALRLGRGHRPTPDAELLVALAADGPD